MLWALLITLLVSKLSGGPEEIFLISGLDKEIKSHIADKERRNELLAISKAARKDIKSFGKIRKNKMKHMDKSGLSKDVSSEQLFELYNSYHEERLKMQAKLIDKRLEIQRLLTDIEWKHLIENAVLPSEKSRRKTEKEENKAYEKIKKIIGGIEETIDENIEDEQKRKSIVVGLEKFNSTLQEFLEETQHMNFEDNELIRSKSASKNELMSLYGRQNNLRLKGTREFFELRDRAMKNTDDKQWKQIIKKINRITKS